MQVTNYWAQPQIPQNKAAALVASTMDFLNTAAAGVASNNSGTAAASQSAISGASPATNFSASLAAASVDTASTGTGTSTTPDFTHSTDQQMWDWINSQVASGAMTKEQSSPFITLTLNTPAEEAALTGNTIGAVNGTGTTVSQAASSSTNPPVFHNFINLAQQYMAGEDHATATFIKPALDMMLKLQSQTSRDIGADLSLLNSTRATQNKNTALA